jgi:hypothetical protein
MTREQMLACGAVLAAAVLGFVFLSPWSPLVQKAAPDGLEGVTWSPHTLSPHRIRGGLFHPPVCGEGRTGLMAHGWAWISSPPSEVTGPGVTSA